MRPQQLGVPGGHFSSRLKRRYAYSGRALTHAVLRVTCASRVTAHSVEEPVLNSIPTPTDLAMSVTSADRRRAPAGRRRQNIRHTILFLFALAALQLGAAGKIAAQSALQDL